MEIFKMEDFENHALNEFKVNNSAIDFLTTKI